MTTTVEMSYKPIQSKLSKDHQIKPGDRVIFFTMGWKRYYVATGTFVGTRTSRRTYMQRWGQRREVTDVTIRYVVQRDDGKKSLMHYARILPIDAPLSALNGVRL